MNEIVKIYKDNQIRIVENNGEIWFVAKDVADVLGYGQAKDMTRRLDESDKGRHSMPTPSGSQEMTIISEAGLYQSILGSKKKEAKDFTRWVTHDVLPSIRRTGSYTAPKPEPKQSLPLDEELKEYIRDLLSASTNFARQCSRLSERNSYLEQFAPKADYGDENVLGQPRYQKRRGYYVANRGADVCKRDPDKYGYQQDLFYDRLPQILTETFNQAVKRLCIED